MHTQRGRNRVRSELLKLVNEGCLETGVIGQNLIDLASYSVMSIGCESKRRSASVEADDGAGPDCGPKFVP